MKYETTVVDMRFAEFDVYIGRAGTTIGGDVKPGESGYFGNPFRLPHESMRAIVLEKFKVYFYERLERDKFFKARVLELRGKVLGCFCHPMPCHGHVIAEYLNSLPCPNCGVALHEGDCMRLPS